VASKKDKLLKMSHGTACYRLRKSIMFSLIKNTPLSVCYRCGERIVLIDEFSIDHKESWENADDPLQSFFDLDNIAFSHLKCNIAAAINPTHIKNPEGHFGCWGHKQFLNKTLFKPSTLKGPRNSGLCRKCKSKQRKIVRQRKNKVE